MNCFDIFGAVSLLSRFFMDMNMMLEKPREGIVTSLLVRGR